jgi:hypothetical protein
MVTHKNDLYHGWSDVEMLVESIGKFGQHRPMLGSRHWLKNPSTHFLIDTGFAISRSASYMMSKEAYLTHHDHHNLAHLMFYAPPLDGTVLGCRFAEITGDAESSVQRRAANRRFYCSRGQVVRWNSCAG